MAYDDEEEMLDEDQDYETSGSMGPLGALSATPEARAVATGVFADLYKQRGSYDDQEQKAFDEYEQRAQEARQTLARARDKLLARKRSKQEMFLAAAAGFGAPTRAGSFAESLGNAAAQVGPVVKADREWDEARDKQVLDYDTAMSGIDQQLSTNRLKLIQARRTADTKLMDSALRIAARPDAQSRWKPLGPQSKYAKMAFDEGLQPGTPGYTARIQQLYDEDQALQREKSGTDVSDELGMDDRVALSRRFGAPINPADAYPGLSTRARQAARQRAAQDTRKSLDALNEESSPYIFSDNQIDRFMYLNKDTPSGPIIGMNPVAGASAQEMDSITSDLARKQKQPGEGSVSNFDAQQFVRATLARTKEYKANENIAKALKARNSVIRDKMRFFNDYAAVNDNNLAGAQQAWNEYLEANPIFDPVQPGAFKLNDKRVGYRDWFNQRSDEQGFAEGGAVEDEEDDRIDRGRGATHSAIQGLSVGLSDELADLFYNYGSDDERALLEQFSNESPATAVGAEIAGAMVPAGVAMSALSRIKNRAQTRGGKTAKVARAALKILPKSKVGKAVAAGAGAGAVSGLTSEGDVNQRLQNAETGAEFGALLGPVGGYVGETALKLGRRGWDKLMSDKSGAGVSRYLEALKRDALTPKDVATRVAEDAKLGVPSSAGDVGGPDVQALTQHVMSKDNPGSTRLVDQTTRLQSSARDRVEDQINRRMKPDPYFAQEQKLVQQMRTNADPLYAAAYAQPPIQLANTPIMEILQTPAGQRALRKTMVTLRNRVPPLPLGKADATGMMTHISTEALDEVKKNLGVLERQALQKQDGNTAALVGNLRRSLVAEADKVNPLYAKARAQFGDDAEVLDALHLGRDEVLNLEPEQIAAQVQNMSFSARDALRTGVARSLMEQVREPAKARNFSEFIQSPAMQDRITAVFERPQDARIFVAALAREAQLSASRGAALRGASQKASSRAHAALEGSRPGDAVGAAGEIAGLGNSFLGELSQLGIMARVLGFLRTRMPMTQGTAEEISNILATGGPKQVRALMDQLEEVSQLAERRAATGESLNELTSGATGIQFGSPDPQGYQQEQ